MEFINTIGSHAVMVDAEFHDKALAHTSQGLYFISKIIKALGLPYESLAGPGYSSMTRLSKQSPLLEETFKRYNSKNISEFLDETIKALENISKDLKK
jgi:prephenate dehydrogenase